MDKNKAIYDLIEEYPALYNWLYFNTIINEVNNASLLTDSDNKVDEFIDGTQVREYIFVVAFMKSYDGGTSDINMEAMRESQNFNSWIKNQIMNGNYPNFGQDSSILDLDVLTEIPILSVDNDSGVAKYEEQFKITYLMKGA